MIDQTLKNSNILIVDDQTAEIDFLEGYLIMHGYTNIKSTTDARKVIPLFQTFAPDLILMNLWMPLISGFEIMKQLKPFILDITFIPILVFASDLTKEAKQSALSEGASDFLNNPFDPIEVGIRIRNLLFTRYLLQQIVSQNQSLEEEVKARTRDLKQNNVALIAAREKAEISNRLKTAFMNNISHEIRTPLSGILGYAPLAIDPSFSLAEKQEFLEILKSSSTRLLQTITNFMDISQITSENMDVLKKDFKPDVLFIEIMEQFQPQCIRKNISLIIEKQESFSSIVINSDKSLIKKILTHLMDNALKFTKEGSIILGVSIKVNLIEFYVKDTGIGITKDALSFIFEHFSQEEVSITRKHDGSGLGLAIVRGIVTLLGGTIKAESTKGTGSTFTFSIPWLENTLNLKTPEIQAHKILNIKRPVILIAEDEPYSFQLFELSLDIEYEIIRAEDGEEAVEFCKLIPEIQLVLMDLKMPKMNGLVATQEIKKFRKNLPIIALTAYAESGIRQKCIDAGCDEYIPKPISKMELIEKITEFLSMSAQ